jgi:uncharacterized protein YndB with AHSA1/START domain
MRARTVTHSTFVIERSFPPKPERVFAAFSDPQKKRRWFAEGEEFEIEAYELDFRVGGTETARFHSKDGVTFINNTVYLDILPQKHIVIVYTMSMGEKRFSSSQATIEFLPTDNGTDLVFTEQGAYFEGADGPKMRQAGWQALFDQLAKRLAN